MTRSIGQIQSRKHEDRLGQVFGGKRTPGSGAFWSAKGDVKTPDMLIEHKFTGKKSYSLSSAVLEKIFSEAVLTGRMPVFGLSLGGKNYVILLEDDFAEIIHEPS